MRMLNFFKRKKGTQTIGDQSKGHTLLALPIFINGDNLKIDKVIESLKSFWGLNVSKTESNSNITTIDIDGAMIVLENMPIPIPIDELEEVIAYTYTWANASKELEHQTGHAIVSISGGDISMVERFTILSKLLCSILITCENCIAIYQKSEILLLHKDHYLAAVDDLKANRIPVPAWIYIGFKQTLLGIDTYTYGMFNFNKPEIEIIESPLDSNHLYRMILSISSYIIGKDITFKDGEIYNLSESIKLYISLSAGVHVKGLSLKFSL